MNRKVYRATKDSATKLVLINENEFSMFILNHFNLMSRFLNADEAEAFLGMLSIPKGLTYKVFGSHLFFVRGDLPEPIAIMYFQPIHYGNQDS